jgi:hypothetical protein
VNSNRLNKLPTVKLYVGHVVNQCNQHHATVTSTTNNRPTLWADEGIEREIRIFAFERLQSALAVVAPVGYMVTHRSHHHGP